MASDVCTDIDTVRYPLATPDDLDETIKLVEKTGARTLRRQVDVRDEAGMAQLVQDTVSKFGRLDVVIANAGIAPMALGEPHDVWRDVIDVNLTGVLNTVEPAIPAMIAGGRGGSIVLTSSISGINGVGGPTRAGLAYTASKHGVVGLMRSYANILAPHSIRVNTVHPTGCNTPGITNDVSQEFLQQYSAFNTNPNALPVGMIEPVDVSNAILWLVSDAARYVTGVTLPVDAGFSIKK